MGCRVLPGFTGTGGGAAGRANELDPPPPLVLGPGPSLGAHTEERFSCARSGVSVRTAALNKSPNPPPPPAQRREILSPLYWPLRTGYQLH